MCQTSRQAQFSNLLGTRSATQLWQASSGCDCIPPPIRDCSFSNRSEMDRFEVTKLLKEKKFWFASILVVWAAGLQGQMMWLQRQDAFQQKFGNLDQKEEGGG